jgi:hypothetical protein
LVSRYEVLRASIALLTERGIYAAISVLFLWLPLTIANPRAGLHRQDRTSNSRIQSCRTCHQAIYDTYLQTAHYRTSAPASSESIKASFSEGHNTLRTRSETIYFRMENRADGFYQTGFDLTRNLARIERIDLVIGSGRKGQSYLYWKNGLLFQLPVSYLTGIGGWINSPGYLDGQINFDRVIRPRCLECHSTSFKLETGHGAVRYASEYELGIACEKCHGDGSKHVQDSASSDILNPKHFERDRQLDNCGLCHSGAWEPRKPPFSYLPGNKLSEYAPAEADAGSLTPDVHGNQIGLLKSTKCFRLSQGMSCSTCHDVHRLERDLTKLAQKCLQCHKVENHKDARKLGTAIVNYCIECHMPDPPSNAIQINTPGKQFSPQYRSHAIGIYPAVAAKVAKTIR